MPNNFSGTRSSPAIRSRTYSCQVWRFHPRSPYWSSLLKASYKTSSGSRAPIAIWLSMQLASLFEFKSNEVLEGPLEPLDSSCSHHHHRFMLWHNVRLAMQDHFPFWSLIFSLKPAHLHNATLLIHVRGTRDGVKRCRLSLAAHGSDVVALFPQYDTSLTASTRTKESWRLGKLKTSAPKKRAGGAPSKIKWELYFEAFHDAS